MRTMLAILAAAMVAGVACGRDWENPDVKGKAAKYASVTNKLQYLTDAYIDSANATQLRASIKALRDLLDVEAGPALRDAKKPTKPKTVEGKP